MSYQTYKAEGVIERIRTHTIPLIDGTPSQYRTTVQRISRTFLVPDELSNDEYPCVCIIADGTAQYTPLTSSQYTTGASRTDASDGAPIMIIGYIALPTGKDETDAGELSTRMNLFHSDLAKAMHEDITFQNQVITTTLTDSSHSVIFVANKKIGIVMQNYSLKYNFEPFPAPVIVAPDSGEDETP